MSQAQPTYETICRTIRLPFGNFIKKEGVNGFKEGMTPIEQHGFNAMFYDLLRHVSDERLQFGSPWAAFRPKVEDIFPDLANTDRDARHEFLAKEIYTCAKKDPYKFIMDSFQTVAKYIGKLNQAQHVLSGKIYYTPDVSTVYILPVRNKSGPSLAKYIPLPCVEVVEGECVRAPRRGNTMKKLAYPRVKLHDVHQKLYEGVSKEDYAVYATDFIRGIMPFLKGHSSPLARPTDHIAKYGQEAPSKWANPAMLIKQGHSSYVPHTMGKGLDFMYEDDERMSHAYNIEEEKKKGKLFEEGCIISIVRALRKVSKHYHAGALCIRAGYHCDVSKHGNPAIMNQLKRLDEDDGYMRNMTLVIPCYDGRIRTPFELLYRQIVREMNRYCMHPDGLTMDGEGMLVLASGSKDLKGLFWMSICTRALGSYVGMYMDPKDFMHLSGMTDIIGQDSDQLKDPLLCGFSRPFMCQTLALEHKLQSLAKTWIKENGLGLLPFLGKMGAHMFCEKHDMKRIWYDYIEYALYIEDTSINNAIKLFVLGKEKLSNKANDGGKKRKRETSRRVTHIKCDSPTSIFSTPSTSLISRPVYFPWKLLTRLTIPFHKMVDDPQSNGIKDMSVKINIENFMKELGFYNEHVPVREHLDENGDGDDIYISIGNDSNTDEENKAEKRNEMDMNFDEYIQGTTNNSLGISEALTGIDVNLAMYRNYRQDCQPHIRPISKKTDFYLNTYDFSVDVSDKNIHDSPKCYATIQSGISSGYMTYAIIQALINIKVFRSDAINYKRERDMCNGKNIPVDRPLSVPKGNPLSGRTNGEFDIVHNQTQSDLEFLTDLMFTWFHNPSMTPDPIKTAKVKGTTTSSFPLYTINFETDEMRAQIKQLISKSILDPLYQYCKQELVKGVRGRLEHLHRAYGDRVKYLTVHGRVGAHELYNHTNIASIINYTFDTEAEGRTLLEQDEYLQVSGLPGLARISGDEHRLLEDDSDYQEDENDVEQDEEDDTNVVTHLYSDYLVTSDSSCSTCSGHTSNSDSECVASIASNSGRSDIEIQQSNSQLTKRLALGAKKRRTTQLKKGSTKNRSSIRGSANRKNKGSTRRNITSLPIHRQIRSVARQPISKEFISSSSNSNSSDSEAGSDIQTASGTNSNGSNTS